MLQFLQPERKFGLPPTCTLGVFDFAAGFAFFSFVTFSGAARCTSFVAIPVLTTSDHNCAFFSSAGDIFFPKVEDFLRGVSPALLRIAAVRRGVASLPWIARMATAFLKSSGGEINSFPGVVVSLAFFALGAFAGDLLTRFPGNFLPDDFVGVGDFCFGLAFTAAGLASAGAADTGDLLLFGLLPGDLLGAAFFGPLAEDFGDPFGVVFFGDLVALGLVGGDLAPLGLVCGDFLRGLSSTMEALAASERRLMTLLSGAPGGAGADFLRGVEPRRSGVDAGNFLSNSSGLYLGPNDTRFLLAELSNKLSRFLFWPGIGDEAETTQTFVILMFQTQATTNI